MNEPQVLLLPGDGIGPEVVAAAVDVLSAVSERCGLKLDYVRAAVGGEAIGRDGLPLPPATMQLAHASRAILLGAVGGPRWDDAPLDRRPEAALMALRKGLQLYANLRPVKLYAELAGASPLREELVRGVDLLIVRELTGGAYFGLPRGIEGPRGERRGFNTMAYGEEEIRRIARVAFEAARGRRRHVTSVDKANVLDVSRLWREVVIETAAEYPEIVLDHLYVDNCAMQLVLRPLQFDVIVTENLFGDILSDEAAVLTGSIGLLPSASLGAGHALYEPIHGSAPDIAGKDIANPLATILSAALMLRYTFTAERAAAAIEQAVEEVLAAGHRTGDLRGGDARPVGTAAMGRLVRERALAILG